MLPDPMPHSASINRSTHRGVRATLSYLMLTMLIVLAGYGVVNGVDSYASQSDSTPPADAPAAQGDGTTYESVADLYDAVNPAVVTIYNQQVVRSTSFQQQPEDANEPQTVAAGSGWIYSDDGYVVTNNHVVDGATDLQVRLHDGTIVDATLVGTDPVQDVAVIQLDMSQIETVPGVATIGNSDDLRVGEEVVSIGTALGEFNNSVSSGVVGGLGRDLQSQTASIDNLIQHDADISSGNSGGPLFNMEGEVVGMNVAAIDVSGEDITSAGLYFAIESNVVVDRVEQIIEDGDVSYPYLGVETQLTEDGPVVITVVEGSPAADAGIEVGDIITAIDGTPVAGTSLTHVLFDFDPGDEITVTVIRDGEELGLNVTLGTRPSELG
jgi:S1-C subfamily serine protease